MSGFLHQLAARTLGLAPQIRPRAALPYAPPQGDPAGTEQPGNDLAAETSQREHRSTSTSSIEPQRSAGVEAAMPSPLVARLPNAPSLAAPPTRNSAELAADEAPRKNPATQIQPRPNPMQLAESMPPLVANAAAQPAPHFNPESAPLPSGSPETAHEASTSQAEGSQRRFADLETLVSQLLGPTLRAHQDDQKASSRSAPDSTPSTGNTAAGVLPIRAQASRERPLNPPRQAEAEVAPEIHITIGRLEVNPPPRPAAPPPSRPRGPAPLSLSDYLARRNGGRP